MVSSKLIVNQAMKMRQIKKTPHTLCPSSPKATACCDTKSPPPSVTPKVLFATRKPVTVKKLEELGIGRPSTYAPTISTIQQREYVQKGDKKGDERTYTIDTLKNDHITSKEKTEVVGNEKGKLLPTDIGTVVNDFLIDNFPAIMDYNFTANVEEKFDEIAEGKALWLKMMKVFLQRF